MGHKLQVLVRLDMDHTEAVLKITGCLTQESSRALFPLIRRIRTLSDRLHVTVDLTDAKHVDPLAVDIVRRSEPAQASRAGRRNKASDSISVTLPPVLPSCPALRIYERMAS